MKRPKDLFMKICIVLACIIAVMAGAVASTNRSRALRIDCYKRGYAAGVLEMERAAVDKGYGDWDISLTSGTPEPVFVWMVDWQYLEATELEEPEEPAEPVDSVVTNSDGVVVITKEMETE